MLEVIQQYWIFVYLAIMVVGVILGFMKKITVYRDYTDVGFVFLLVLVPVAILILCTMLLKLESGTMIVVYWFVGVIEAIVLASIVYKTHQDNRNIWKTILSILVKLPISIFFVAFIISFVAPSGKNLSTRNSSKGLALIFVMMFGIIINGLVASKKWSSIRMNRFGYL